MTDHRVDVDVAAISAVEAPRRSLADRVPTAFVLISGLLLIAAALTWIIPPGQFERVQRDGRTVVVPGTYQRILPDGPLAPGNEVRPQPQGLHHVARAPLRGFQDAAGIIVFILVLGGAFKVMEATGAIRSGLAYVVRAAQGREIMVIPIVMLCFSLGGSIFGMAEETIPFVMIVVPLALALGYDSVTAVCMVFVAAMAGFSAAFINPFTLGIAQGIAELPPVSGFGYRVVAWAVSTTAAILYVVRYARRIRRDPTRSPTYELDQARREKEGFGLAGADNDWLAATPPLSGRHKAVLALFAVTLMALVAGVLRWGWYIDEIAALFIGFTVLTGLVGRLGGNGTVDAFVRGAGELLGAALVVGLARGVVLLAQDGGIIDPLLHALSSGISLLPPVFSAQLMFLVQSVLNLLVPSGSGQAALTMPIMAPLADLIGITRQTAVLAFQFGDGFTNIIVPTNPVLLGVLGAARIPWALWARWVTPFLLVFILLGMVLLVPPVLMKWGPF